MKYTTPNYEMNKIETSDIITASAEITMDTEKNETAVSVGVDKIIGLIGNVLR